RGATRPVLSGRTVRLCRPSRLFASLLRFSWQDSTGLPRRGHSCRVPSSSHSSRVRRANLLILFISPPASKPVHPVQDSGRFPPTLRLLDSSLPTRPG